MQKWESVIVISNIKVPVVEETPLSSTSSRST